MLKRLLKLLQKRWYIGLVLLALVGFIFYRQQSGAQGKKQNAYKVQIQTLKEQLTFSGKVDADEKVDLQFQSAGRLIWVGVKKGDSVKKGQAIAALDQRQLQKTMQKFLNTYVKTRLTFDQQQEDIRPVVIGALSKDQQERLIRAAQQAQYDLNNSVLDVEVQNISVEYSNLYTPIEGIVDHVDTPVAGVNLTLTNPSIFRVVNPKTLFFAATADQTEVTKLHEGEQGEINFDSYPDENIPATVASIAFSPKEGETGTVYEVKINFLPSEESGYKYRLGMTGDISFTLREISNVISIPSAYITSENGKHYVVRGVNGKKEKIVVGTGETIEGQTVITSGLQEGDTVYD